LSSSSSSSSCSPPPTPTTTKFKFNELPRWYLADYSGCNNYFENGDVICMWHQDAGLKIWILNIKAEHYYILPLKKGK
jgi:hypothetical protein